MGKEGRQEERKIKSLIVNNKWYQKLPFKTDKLDGKTVRKTNETGTCIKAITKPE